MDAKVYRAALEGSWEKLDSEGWHDQVTPMGNRVLHVHVGRQVIKKERVVLNIEFIKSVLDQEIQGGARNLLWDENANGEIPLHLAARFGQVEAVEEFLGRAKVVSEDEVRKMLRKTNKKKDTAMHEAARGGHGQVVKLLIEAHPSCSYEANDAKETPLYLAAESGIAACVAAILDNCASSKPVYDHKGPCGRTALHALVQWEDPEILHTVLKKDESLVRLQDDEGSTPVHLVAADNKLKHLEVLLSYDKKTKELSATYIRDNEGRTPLHIATLHLRWDTIKKLIEYSPDCIEMVDNKGQNVLHYAAKWACIDKLKDFLKLEIDLNKLMYRKDLDGNTPIHLVAANVPYMTYYCILELKSFIKDQHQCMSLFNNENLTAADILASYDFNKHLADYERILLMGRGAMRLIVPVCGRTAFKKNKLEDAGRETAKDVLEKKATQWKVAAQNQIIVAALVATVSFAAGFTVPGGFNQNPDDPDNIGTAVMTKKSVFKAFLISDAIALTLSCFATLLYFQGADATNPTVVLSLLTYAKVNSVCSVGAMMAAFATGVYVVVPHSPPLHVALIIIPAFLFITYARAFVTAFSDSFQILGRCRGPLQPCTMVIPAKRNQIHN